MNEIVKRFSQQEINSCLIYLQYLWTIYKKKERMLEDHLQKTKEKIQKFKETGDSRYIYQNELDKTCF